MIGKDDQWDWELGERAVSDLSRWEDLGKVVPDIVVSEDGERIAAPVHMNGGDFGIVVNGTPWEHQYERIWSLQFGPNDALACLTVDNDARTVLVEDTPWEETFDFAWNLTFSRNGESIAANVRKDMDYAVALNGKIWEKTYPDARTVSLSPEGRHTAAPVQTERLAEADIFAFQGGVYTVAVDGEPWADTFLTVWDTAFSDDGRECRRGSARGHDRVFDRRGRPRLARKV